MSYHQSSSQDGDSVSFHDKLISRMVIVLFGLVMAVISWTLGSVSTNIRIPLRTRKTEVWNHLEKGYQQSVVARKFEVEHEIFL